ncbi:MAG: hypothetical protein Q4D62_05445 [Planctomycetia bacterium]|nr:hypothetical protein [Planctomycetia bacterium]
MERHRVYPRKAPLPHSHPQPKKPPPHKGTRWVQPLHSIVERALRDYHDSLKAPQPTDILYPA